MPEFTNDDRLVLQAEQSLWNAHTIMAGAAVGDWRDRVLAVREEVENLAREMLKYNDQFEVE